MAVPVFFPRRAVMVGALLAVALTGCSSGDDGDGAIPTNLRMESVYGIAVPLADQGPEVVSGIVATGFAHNPAGAGLAATNTLVRLGVAKDDEWADVAAASVVYGKGRDDYMVGRTLTSVQPGEVDPATKDKIQGFLVTDYTDEQASVKVCRAFPGDDHVVINTATVKWVGADWKVELPEAQSDAPTVVRAEQCPDNSVLFANN